MSSEPTVAVIDIGSNSIKVLVAARGPEGRPVAREMRTLDARISAGIGGAKLRLTEESIERGVSAVRELLSVAAPHAPAKVLLVATSAVRDAANGADFCRRILKATGHEVRILSGDEEAGLIGRGLRCDPALSDLKDFYLFDLGGGSLECLSFRGRRNEAAVSLPLGCVRLTERFVSDPSAPFTAAAAKAVALHTRDVLAGSGFAFGLAPGSGAVGTGGTLTAARMIVGARGGKSLEETETILSVDGLRELLSEIGGLPLADRARVPGLPPRRADVFPTALATLIAIAEMVPFAAYRHSLYNLRWGLAAEALETFG
jgi:exopolyphosphatase/guanosine-5'-triphosphate,3'-diphosphate pyrophosphatase